MREYFAVETEYTIKDIEYEIVDEPYLGYKVHPVSYTHLTLPTSDLV